MDPWVTFLQTLIGSACYSQGLRDKGFKILNVFASVFRIRQHGSVWTKSRSALEELSSKAFWRVTIDNFDFRIKYAKKIMECCSGALRRMLNLLTSQVTFRQGSVRNQHTFTNK